MLQNLKYYSHEYYLAEHSECNSGEGITNTFQNNKSKQELLKHSLVRTTMIYNNVANLETGV